MIDFITTLIHGLLICLPFSAFALITFSLRPRLWLHSLPPDIQRMTAPKTETERRQTKFVLLPLYLLILPGLSIISTLFIAQTRGIDVSFLDDFVHIYGIWVIVHIWDFAIIDSGTMLFLDPSHPPIPDTKGAAGWKDLGFHFRALLRAIPLSLLFVVPSAAAVSFLV